MICEVSHHYSLDDGSYELDGMRYMAGSIHSIYPVDDVDEFVGAHQDHVLTSDDFDLPQQSLLLSSGR